MEQKLPRMSSGLDTWTTVTLGEHASPEEYRQAMRSAGLCISDWGGAVLDQVRCSGTVTQLQLVRMPVGYLGFPVAAPCFQIYEEAREFGLELCPAEVGPALRLQYPGSHHPKWLLIAMDPVVDVGGQKSIFRLGGPSCCRGPELTCGLGHPDVSYGADAFFVFALAR